jgi:flagellar assembly factor FliW
MTASTAATLLAPAPMQTPPTVAPAVQVLSLADPLPGFPGLRDFALVPADANGLVFWLQSVAPDGPRFLTVPAAPYFPEYAPALPRAACAELGIDDAAAADVYVLITVPDGEVAEATANLRAPLVVNPTTHRGRQIVLTDGGHPIRQPLRR